MRALVRPSSQISARARDTEIMKTTHVRAADAQERWLLYDASEHRLGRMATEIAMALMGKDRATWTPSELTGAHVVVINGAKAVVTGKKAEQKTYDHYTRYAGGLKVVRFADVRYRGGERLGGPAVRLDRELRALEAE